MLDVGCRRDWGWDRGRRRECLSRGRSGRKLGRGFVLRHGPKLRITEARLETVEGYFERYGGRTIIVGRFIGLVHLTDLIFYAFAVMTIAGAAGCAFSRNIIYSAWSLLFAFMGVAGIYVFLGADFPGFAFLLSPMFTALLWAPANWLLYHPSVRRRRSESPS